MINEIEIEKKEICFFISDILGEMCRFYEKLYNFNLIFDNEINLYLGDCEIKYLIENDKKICDSFLIFEECKDVVMNLKLNKFLGLDGILNEFY